MHRLLPIAGCLLLMAGGTAAADPLSGSADLLASNCYNCHGTDGRTTAGIPPLAGLEKGYLVEALKDYKAGGRDPTIMHQLAKGYTDEEIATLADFFSRQKP